MIEIAIKMSRDLSEDLAEFDHALRKIGLQIVKQQIVNSCLGGRVALTINAQTGSQAKKIHGLACEYFRQAYVFLSLAA